MQDTPDFICCVEAINIKGTLPDNAMLATVDVSSLFTVIPQEEGAECMRQNLNTRQNQQVPTEYLIRILEVCNEHNIFEFNGDLYKQKIGSGMGSRPTPPYANNYMGSKIDPRIREIAKQMSKDGLMHL